MDSGKKNVSKGRKTIHDLVTNLFASNSKKNFKKSIVLLNVK